MTTLSSPSRDTAALAPSRHLGGTHLATLLRRNNAVGAADYLVYVAAATGLIYASDPLSALTAAKASGAKIVYHGHDSPNPGALRAPFARWRAAVARRASLAIAPNRERGEIMRQDLGFSVRRLKIVWNLPRRAELSALAPHEEGPLRLYYHGSITPERRPEAVRGRATIEADWNYDTAFEPIIAAPRGRQPSFRSGVWRSVPFQTGGRLRGA